MIWRDSGDIARLELINEPGGPDGAFVAPFRFVEEHNRLTGMRLDKGRTSSFARSLRDRISQLGRACALTGAA